DEFSDQPVKIAIVHDYLTQRGGAERVVLSMMKAWPGAPVYTSLYEPDGAFPDFKGADIRVLPLNRVPAFRRNHRAALPFLARAFSRLEVPADVVVCSSSGWAHGVKTQGRKIVYCYTPARWLYQTDRYLGTGHPLARTALQAMAPGLRRWDGTAAATASAYFAISSAVQTRVQQIYGIDAQVLTPPHAVDPAGPRLAVSNVAPPFFLSVTRLLPYKNVDALLEAFWALPKDQLLVVGAGPEQKRLQKQAPGNVRFLGTVSDEQLRWLYSNCEALISPSHEDLGLTPLEAATFGKPSAVLKWGGFLDTVKEGVTGVFFEEPKAGPIAAAVAALRKANLEPQPIISHAEQFSEPIFINRLREIV
ncbi:MAG: glycosyltransferase, partial [Actinomycetota bacterium]